MYRFFMPMGAISRFAQGLPRAHRGKCVVPVNLGESAPMSDVIFLGVGLISFGLLAAYVFACGKA